MNTVKKPDLDIDLHFQRINAFALLTHDGEVSLARRLERTDLSITRMLLGSPEGREALREVVRGLREKELRIEEVERNPKDAEGGADLPTRIEKLVLRAHKRSKKLRWLPRADGLRLHPRIVARIAKELPAIEGLRRRADAITADFVHANLRIVVTFARRYRGLALVDLVQEGNFGLLRAIDKFDHRRGLRFSTYAAWWIRHALTRALADQSRMIRLPVHLTGAVLRVRRAQDRLMRETGIAPTPEELALRTGLPIANVRRALDVVAQPVSLDAMVGDEKDTELVDLVADTSQLAADDAVAETQLKEGTRELLATPFGSRGGGPSASLRRGRPGAAYAGGDRRSSLRLARTRAPNRARRTPQAESRERRPASACATGLTWAGATRHEIYRRRETGRSGAVNFVVCLLASSAAVKPSKTEYELRDDLGKPPGEQTLKAPLFWSPDSRLL